MTDLTGRGKYFAALKSSFEHVLTFFIFKHSASNTYHVNVMQSPPQIKHPEKKNSSEKIKEQDARPASKVQDMFCWRTFSIFLHHHHCKYLIRCLGLWNVFYDFSEGGKYNNSSLQHCTAAPLILAPVFMLH